MTTTTYSPGTDAREAIAALERRGCPLEDRERDALHEIGRQLEAQGATTVLRSYADGHIKPEEGLSGRVARILDTFRHMGGARALCRTGGARRDGDVRTDGAGGSGCGCDGKGHVVSDARATYVDRLREAWNQDAEPPSSEEIAEGRQASEKLKARRRGKRAPGAEEPEEEASDMIAEAARRQRDRMGSAWKGSGK